MHGHMRLAKHRGLKSPQNSLCTANLRKSLALIYLITLVNFYGANHGP